MSETVETLKATLKLSEIVELEKDELKIKTQDLEKTIKQSDDNLLRLKNSLKEREFEISELNAEVQALKDINRQLELENDSLHQQLEEITAKLSDEIEISNRLREGSANMVKKVSELQAEIFESKQELNRQHSEAMKLKCENESLVINHFICRRLNVFSKDG